VYLFFSAALHKQIMAVDHCACRDKHCAHKNEDSAAAKIHTNKLLDKAFFKMQCPSFEHQLCERDVNCGFDHDVASNQRRTAGADDCDNIVIPADDLPEEHKQVVKSGRQKAALQSGASNGKKKARDDRDIYGMHNCDPHKYYKSGYGGFVPFVGDLVGMNSTAESHVGANRMTDFQDKMACLEAMCREKYLNFDPCSVTEKDLKRGPGWMQPDKAYAKCLKDGFNQADGAGTSLNIGYRCESDRNKELKAMMEADLAAMDAEAGDDPCPKGKGDKCTCSEEEKRKFAEQKKKDDCQETSKCPSAKIDIGRRVVYDKRRGMIPGYGGHVPGIHICTQGGNFGNLTRRVLKQTVSSERLRKGEGC